MARAQTARQPTAMPPFTVGTLRKAIPPHCFERLTLRSFSYLATDLLGVALLYYASAWFAHPAVPAVVRWGLLWPAYWVLQGAVCTGLWVIAHECGHQVTGRSFRPSAWPGCSAPSFVFTRTLTARHDRGT